MSLQTILTSFLAVGHNEKQNKCRTLTKRDDKMFITTKKIPNLPYEIMDMILGDTEKQEREEHKKKMFMVLSQLSYIRSGQLDVFSLSFGEEELDGGRYIVECLVENGETPEDRPENGGLFTDYALDEEDEDRRKDVFAPNKKSHWWMLGLGLDRKFCEPWWWRAVEEASDPWDTLALMKLLE